MANTLDFAEREVSVASTPLCQGSTKATTDKIKLHKHAQWVRFSLWGVVCPLLSNRVKTIFNYIIIVNRITRVFNNMLPVLNAHLSSLNIMLFFPA